MEVVIEYCVRCQWMLRSAWYQQELLQTFTSKAHSESEAPIASVTLKPSFVPGTFKISVNGEVIWDRGTDGGFPDVKVLKQKVRDVVDPSRNLGHNESKKLASPENDVPLAKAVSYGSTELQPITSIKSSLSSKHTFCDECVEKLPPTWEM